MGRKHKPTPSARALVAAFGGVAVSFLLATVASEWSDVRIRRDAAQITRTAAPSIVHLEAFRSEARRLVVLADDEVDRALARSVAHSVDRSVTQQRRAAAGPAPAAPATSAAAAAAISASTERLRSEWLAYGATQALPREHELAALVTDLQKDFLEDVARVLESARAGEAASALDLLERRVKPAADAVDDATVKLVERNAEAATRLGARIDRLGRRSIALALGLDGLSVLLTISAALLVLRFFRRYARLVEQRAEELELFASRVAHDVLSPLGAASLALSYLADKGNLTDARARKMLTLGQRGIERTRLIADDLLEFASAGARPDPAARAELRAVVAAVVDEARALADERKVELLIDGVVAGSVRCSQGILSSLVSNLVRNAVKYVGEGPGKHVRVRVRALGGFMRVEVEDNGPGLPPSMEAAVFEPYVRGPNNKQAGIGLGLATVKRVAEAHGGRVDVRSMQGAGCCFGVELPAATSAREEQAGAEQADARQVTADEKPLPAPENPPRVTEDERRRGIPAEDPNPPRHAG
jgi:signal transduction histidine kinase